MVVAFVQPNDPAVDRLLKAAALALEASGRRWCALRLSLHPIRCTVTIYLPVLAALVRESVN